MSNGYFSELQEYIVVAPETFQEEVRLVGSNVSATHSAPVHWTRPMTLRLLSDFAERRKQIGESVKSQKRMFEILADMLNHEFNLALTWLQVSNKWKSLERTYKEVIDNNNHTGKRRRDFEFEEQMATIIGKKRNVNPVTLLSENAELITPPAKIQRELTDDNKDPEVPQPCEMAGVEEATPPPRKLKRIEQNRQDRRAAAEQRRKRCEEKLLLQRRMVEAIEQRNVLAKERNNLLTALLGKLEKQ